MTTDEQRRLVIAWRGGDTASRERLIVGLIPSVRLRVQHMSGRKPLDSELREDLISEGTVGLVQGLEKFDLSRLDVTAPWGYAQHWVDLRIREAMVRLIPPVSYRNYMGWWRTGADRKLEMGEAFDRARDENDELLASTLPSGQLDPEELLLDAERPAVAWTSLRDLVPAVPDEEWELFSLRVLHRLTVAQVVDRYRQTWPYWREDDVDRVPKRVLARIIAVAGIDGSTNVVMTRLRRLLPEDDAPEAPAPPKPTSTREWSLSPSPPVEKKSR